MARKKVNGLIGKGMVRKRQRKISKTVRRMVQGITGMRMVRNRRREITKIAN